MLNSMRPVDVFGVQSGIGGHTLGTEKGPTALRDSGLMEWLGGGAAWHDVGDAGETRIMPENLIIKSIARICRDLAQGVERAVRADRSVLALGGDHSCAIGTWSGIANALEGGPLGLVWIDAHMDSHTPDTTPSGNLHGMPVAHLLGRGARPLVEIARRPPAVRPEHLALVGVRSFEPEEPALMRELGVRVFAMDEIAARGLAAVMDEALAIAARATAAHGISIDLDAIDPVDVPGTGSPVEDGLDAGALIGSLAGLAGRPQLVAIEIAEFNPMLDKDGVTLGLMRRLIESAYGTAAPA